jgi:hypothetical protein
MGRLPIVGPVARNLFQPAARPRRARTSSACYWLDRYASGGNSGLGSYGELAEFKAGILNGFVREHGIRTVIEYGCGDGNQLKLAHYPSYTGFDISPAAIARCRELFAGDQSKTFLLMSEYDGRRAQMALSLDVVYHLVEEDVFGEYMCRLFDFADEFVVVYSSDTDENQEGQVAHIRHRKFTAWVARAKPEWRLRRRIANRYPAGSGAQGGSAADFYIFEKA